MIGPLHFSRVRLSREASAANLAPLLLPRSDAAAAAAHRLVWSLFADDESRTRDFLYRELRPGEFLILGARPPVDRHNLFEVETKPFEPRLEAGDLLSFSLRVNPVVARSVEGKRRSKRDDAVMSLKNKIAREEADDPGSRYELERRAGHDWLAARAAKAGFSLDGTRLAVGAYRTHRIERGSGSPIRFATLDLDGFLTISSPADFVAAMARGFGAAKAFGCGLMLIRRA